MAEHGPQATAATVGLRPRHQAQEDPTTQLLTPAAVLYDNELRRGQLWVKLSGHLAIIELTSAIFITAPGQTARVVLACAGGALLAASLIGWRVLRNRARYNAAEAALFGYFSLATAIPAYYFFGWFSPALVVVCLGAIIFSMGHTPRANVAMAASISTSHLTVGALTIAGVLPDVAVTAVQVQDTLRAVVALVGLQALFLISFRIGRQLRAHALDGVERYGDAVRDNLRRELLLQEAVDELHRARRVGDPGRFTGVELGSFRLGVVLGRGGMGEVYEATHLHTREPAAVKVLAAGPQTDRTARRFEREIALAAGLHSRHIVRVIEHSAPEDLVAYLAMERLQGKTLSEELRERPEALDLLRMLREVADALDTAHAAGIVHRDIKPENIFHHVQDEDDVWKVLDFGVSKLTDGNSSLTGMALVGTPNYMSPEQASGYSVSARSDLFAFGCVAYRCLTGRPAFRGSELNEVLAQVIHEMPACPSRAAPLPVEVDLVLAIALAKAPEDRFESASELTEALVEACNAHIAPDLQRRAESLLRRAPWSQDSRRA